MIDIVPLYAKLRLPDMVVVSTHGQVSREALEAIEQSPTADALVSKLETAGAYQDLCKLLPFMLPKREAVWLACLWARAQEGVRKLSDVPVTESKALRLAEDWVRTQDDQLRYAAHQASDREQMEGPAQWAGMAAFWAGASMAPPDLDPVRPDDALTSIACLCTLNLAAADTADDLPFIGFKGCAAIGQDIARGGSGTDALKSELEAFAGSGEASKESA